MRTANIVDESAPPCTAYPASAILTRPLVLANTHSRHRPEKGGPTPNAPSAGFSCGGPGRRGSGLVREGSAPPAAAAARDGGRAGPDEGQATDDERDDVDAGVGETTGGRLRDHVGLGDGHPSARLAGKAYGVPPGKGTAPARRRSRTSGRGMAAAKQRGHGRDR